MMCSPTRPARGWSKASGMVARISNPSDCHSPTAAVLASTLSGVVWMDHEAGVGHMGRRSPIVGVHFGCGDNRRTGCVGIIFKHEGDAGVYGTTAVALGSGVPHVQPFGPKDLLWAVVVQRVGVSGADDGLHEGPNPGPVGGCCLSDLHGRDSTCPPPSSQQKTVAQALWKVLDRAADTPGFVIAHSCPCARGSHPSTNAVADVL
jgi:hypothetical protein